MREARRASPPNEESDPAGEGGGEGGRKPGAQRAAGERSQKWPGAQRAAGERSQKCDFCGEVVASVRRVALDHDYERLATRHVVRYACPSCSDDKERERLDRTPEPG